MLNTRCSGCLPFAVWLRGPQAPAPMCGMVGPCGCNRHAPTASGCVGRPYRRLRRLELRHCSRVTDTGLRAVANRCKDLQVKRVVAAYPTAYLGKCWRWVHANRRGTNATCHGASCPTPFGNRGMALGACMLATSAQTCYLLLSPSSLLSAGAFVAVPLVLKLHFPICKQGPTILNIGVGNAYC